MLNLVPASTQHQLTQFIKEGKQVNAFLRCVLCNDLAGAVTRANAENLAALPTIAQWLYSEAPDACWGTEAKYLRWIEQHEKRPKIGPQEN